MRSAHQLVSDDLAPRAGGQARRGGARTRSYGTGVATGAERSPDGVRLRRDVPGHGRLLISGERRYVAEVERSKSFIVAFGQTPTQFFFAQSDF
jgi:hypothetical protein